MKKYFFILAFLIICGNAFCAELLVKAKDSPYKTGSKKGDVIVVRPDGWEWGKNEGLPNYIIVKLKGVKVEDVKHYEEKLEKKIDQTYNGDDVSYNTTIKKRKYNIEDLSVREAISNKTKEITISKNVSLSVKEKKVSDYEEVIR